MSLLSNKEASEYWRKVTAEHSRGGRLILIAREAGAGHIVGSAQLAFETRANGRHRAEVQKMMVHTAHRRKGIATSLVTTLETHARTRGVTLLFLDTSEGRGGARAFYETVGYQYAGGIPDYALDPDGTPAANAIFYKRLAPTP